MQSNDGFGSVVLYNKYRPSTTGFLGADSYISFEFLNVNSTFLFFFL